MEKIIHIQDNTIRDGLQQTNLSKGIVTKKEILSEIKLSGIESVEVGMCSRQDEVKFIMNLIEVLNQNQDAVILTRMIKEDIDIVVGLSEKNENIVLKLLVPISDLHIEIKLGTSKVIYLERLNRILNYLGETNLRVEVCLEDATRADEEYLFTVLELLNGFDVEYVTIADTVGCATPKEYGDLFKVISEKNYRFKFFWCYLICCVFCCASQSCHL